MDSVQYWTMKSRRLKYAPFLEAIRGLRFVRKIWVKEEKARGTNEELTIHTKDSGFPFRLEAKLSYVDRALLQTLVASTKAQGGKNAPPLLLFARYIPQPSAEVLIEAGVNFVDLAGNIHLQLGDDYSWTFVGKRETKTSEQKSHLTATKVQLLFAFATDDRLARGTVRQVAEASKLTKSNVANLRKQLVEEGLLIQKKEGFALKRDDDLTNRITQGYRDLLRPRLLINRYRSPDDSLEDFLARTKDVFAKTQTRWSLGGGWGAHCLQQFYRGREITLFVDEINDNQLRQLRLLPDAKGPIILMRSIGTPSYWKTVKEIPVAHPWLLFAELLQSTDPRGLEAAEKVREEFLRDE